MHSFENVNKLEVLIDWLSFTTFSFSSPDDLLDYLGFSESDFTICNGSYGYKASLRHNIYPITILYNGNDNMGIHVNISGSGISVALDAYVNSLKEITPWGDYSVEYKEEGYLISYLCYLNECVKFTRIDLAMDDKGCNYFSVDDVQKICNDGRCATRFRVFRSERESSFGDCVTGNTLYIGKRSSDCFLRVYDKRLEQKTKMGNDVGYDWVRWELELKRDRAQSVVEHLLSGECLGSVAVGVLSNYFRVIICDDSNKTRCSTDPVWQKFVLGVGKLRLSVNRMVKTISEKKKWITKQCLPSIAAVCAYEHGDLSFILDYLNDALYKNSKSVLDMVFKENPLFMNI
ncbi:MAG: replication initiation factor domain-containing protein [Lachnospiraceae bacterium]|nr:replication initiation factor domain-containing protein [Lachnospiraceae bacterium]